MGQLRWIGNKCFDWSVVTTGSVLIYSLGAAALFGDEYIIAACMFFAAVCWVTVKLLVWEETRKQENKRILSLLIMAVGVAIFWFSMTWVQHRKDVMEHAPPDRQTMMAHGLMAVRHSVTAFLSKTWPQRIIFLFLGMLLMLVIQFAFMVLSRLSKRRNAALAANKGYLDFKLQAETAMKDLAPALKVITEITNNVARFVTTQTQETQRAALMGTSFQLRVDQRGQEDWMVFLMK